MTEEIDTTNHIELLLKSTELQTEAERVSLRLGHLVGQLAAMFSSVGDEWLPHQEEELHQAFKTITYTRQQNSGPICWTCDQKLKYYQCFDCEISNACFCEKCFNGPQHAGHQFKIVPPSINNYCDCGNQQYVQREHFCREHRGRRNEEETQERSGMDGKESGVKSRERELFGREMEFLLYLGLEAKRRSIKTNPQRALLIALKTLHILAMNINNSYTYQRLTSQLLLQPFRYQKAEKETILHLLMWQEWNSDPLSTILAKIFCQLCACKKAKKSILIEYFHLHASQERFVVWSNPLTQIDNQYFLQGSLILRLLKAKLISPLIYNCTFNKGDQAALRLIQIYRAYRIMHESASFREILEESLAVLNFSKFFSFATIDRDNRALLNQVTNYYLVFLKIIVQRLQQFKDKQAAERKIIRQCYQYIKGKEELYSFAPERTLGWIIFSHCNCDLATLTNCSVQQMMELLGEENLDILKETIQKMLEGFCNIFRIQNYNDYRELTSQNSEFNTHNKFIISMDYTTVRIIITFMQILSRESGGETAPLRNLQVAKHSMLQKWTYLFKTEKMKKESMTDPQAKAQIINLMETGLFVKVDDQIAGVAIELIGIVNNLLFACETDICETVLSNCINKAQHSKVMKILRQFAWMHPNKTKLQFKSHVESIIFNQKLIKEFILSRQEIMRNTKVEQYQSNLTYCSRYFSDDITDDTSQRFLKKLQSSRQGTNLTRFLFSDAMIARMIKFTELFIKLITTSIDLKEAATINVTFNLLIQSLVIIFTQTRNQKLKKLIMRINDIQVLKDNYTDYTVIIIRILMDYFSQKEEAEDQAKRKEAAKLKRQQKMRQIKQKQSKFLQQHCSSNKIQEKVQQNIDLCIICKTPSSQQRQLSYLCKIRFSNTLTRSILSSDNIMMVITTCGHKIHESCLASNIDARDKYGTKYHCFLCKHISNIRVPINLQPAGVQTFLQYFLTIISLEMSSNASLKDRTEEYQSISNLSKLLYDNIVLSIFLYFFSLSKFYNAYILPIVGAQISVLKWLRQSFAVPRRVDYSGKDQRIRLVQNKLNNILDAKVAVQQIGSKEETEQIDQLFLKIYNLTQPPISQIKKINRFNFLQLPHDLRSLTKLVGKCKYCGKYNNKTMVCFLCNFKCCSDCNPEINKHIDLHLGTCVLIDVENGHICYRFRNIQVQAKSLYTNYVGEEFADETELPPKGEFQLNQQRLQKLIDQVLKDQIQSIVEEYVRQAEVPPDCNIQ